MLLLSSCRLTQLQFWFRRGSATVTVPTTKRDEAKKVLAHENIPLLLRSAHLWRLM